jgi:hypothetical protein
MALELFPIPVTAPARVRQAYTVALAHRDDFDSVLLCKGSTLFCEEDLVIIVVDFSTANSPHRFRCVNLPFSSFVN